MIQQHGSVYTADSNLLEADAERDKITDIDQKHDTDSNYTEEYTQQEDLHPKVEAAKAAKAERMKKEEEEQQKRKKKNERKKEEEAQIEKQEEKITPAKITTATGSPSSLLVSNAVSERPTYEEVTEQCQSTIGDERVTFFQEARHAAANGNVAYQKFMGDWYIVKAISILKPSSDVRTNFENALHYLSMVVQRYNTFSTRKQKVETLLKENKIIENLCKESKE